MTDEEVRKNRIIGIIMYTMAIIAFMGILISFGYTLGSQ